MNKTKKELLERRDILLKEIELAFEWVVLWDWIWPHEALAIDDYVDENSNEYKLAKEKDQSIWHWNSARASELVAWEMTMLFFWDSEWQRFALPAIMTQRLKGWLWEDDVDYSAIPRLGDWDLIGDYVNSDIIALLTNDQKKVVEKYLTLLRDLNKFYSKRMRQYAIKNSKNYPLSLYEKILLLISWIWIIVYILLLF